MIGRRKIICIYPCKNDLYFYYNCYANISTLPVLRNYSIKDIEKLTGIKAHTLRIWEQRYNFLVPHRTETNIRYYDDEQLKHLLNISLLLNRGHKISKLSQLTDQEIQKEVRDTYEKTQQDLSDYNLQFKINGLIVAMLELDESRFEKIFSTSILKMGMEKTITQLIFPFLQRMGLMWRIGEISSAQEHFMYSLIRQKIIVAIDSLQIPPKTNEKFVLFLPESEYNDLVIFLYTYVLKAKKRQIINLGQDIVFEDLRAVCDMSSPDYLITFITSPASQPAVQQYVDELSRYFEDYHIFIAGSVDFMSEVIYPENVTLITSLALFSETLASID